MSWEIQYIICRGTFRPAARHAANEAEKFIAILLVYNQFKFWFVFCFYFSLLFILRNCMCVYVDFCFCLKLLRFLLAYSFALSFNLYLVIVYFVCIVNWRQIILICSFVLSAARLICIYFILVVCLLFLWVFFSLSLNFIFNFPLFCSLGLSTSHDYWLHWRIIVLWLELDLFTHPWAALFFM